MNHRSLSFPILGAVVVSFLAGPSFPAWAEPGVPSENTSSSTNTHLAVTAPTVPPPATSTTATPEAAEHSATYTVVSGDSLWTIGQKFGCTSTQLEKLNKLKKHALLHPGQVLQIPPAKTSPPVTPTPAATAPKQPKTTSHSSAKPKTTVAASHGKTAGARSAYVRAQTVQDFDIPASTFASCPVPVPSDSDAEPSDSATSDSAATEAPAPVAKLVSPSEFAASSEPPSASTDESMPPQITATTNPPPRHTKKAEMPPLSNVAISEPAPSPVPAPAPRPPSLFSRIFSPFVSSPANDWASRFLQEARLLGNEGIEYDESWRPPGEAHAWAMDCSNTTRYIYKVITGIQLPRTASDQYYYLHLQNKAWDVPQTASGYANSDFLRQNLKPGDLLFWENTYRPERQPPITHVMVFLGTNDRGQWIMAGSQTSRGGEHNRPNGGPDIYVFRPSQPCGGYTTWLGLVHHQGRFCAYGRPLEADASKLAVAAND